MFFKKKKDKGATPQAESLFLQSQRFPVHQALESAAAVDFGLEDPNQVVRDVRQGQIEGNAETTGLQLLDKLETTSAASCEEPILEQAETSPALSYPEAMPATAPPEVQTRVEVESQLFNAIPDDIPVDPLSEVPPLEEAVPAETETVESLPAAEDVEAEPDEASIATDTPYAVAEYDDYSLEAEALTLIEASDEADLEDVDEPTPWDDNALIRQAKTGEWEETAKAPSQHSPLEPVSGFVAPPPDETTSPIDLFYPSQNKSTQEPVSSLFSVPGIQETVPGQPAAYSEPDDDNIVLSPSLRQPSGSDTAFENMVRAILTSARRETQNFDDFDINQMFTSRLDTTPQPIPNLDPLHLTQTHVTEAEESVFSVAQTSAQVTIQSAEAAQSSWIMPSIAEAAEPPLEAEAPIPTAPSSEALSPVETVAEAPLLTVPDEPVHLPEPAPETTIDTVSQPVVAPPTDTPMPFTLPTPPVEADPILTTAVPVGSTTTPPVEEVRKIAVSSPALSQSTAKAVKRAVPLDMPGPDTSGIKVKGATPRSGTPKTSTLGMFNAPPPSPSIQSDGPLDISIQFTAPPTPKISTAPPENTATAALLDEAMAAIEIPPFDFDFAPDNSGALFPDLPQHELEAPLDVPQSADVPPTSSAVSPPHTGGGGFSLFNFDDPPMGSLDAVQETDAEALEILASVPVLDEFKLMLIHHEGIFALMMDNGTNAALLKSFSENPLEENDQFIVTEEAVLGNKVMYIVQIGDWQGIISLESDEAKLQAEF